MQLVFSHENIMVVTNIKNLLEAENIQVLLKNEFCAGATGEVPVFDAWPEIFVVDDNQLSKAKTIIEQANTSYSGPDWFCKYCKEVNDASFEICWQCQQAPE